jgi:putative sterol carrier protein
MGGLSCELDDDFGTVGRPRARRRVTVLRLALNSVYIFRRPGQIRRAGLAGRATRPKSQEIREQGMSRLEELTTRMKTAVGSDSGLGRTLKFNLKGEGFVYIDGGTVSNDDKPADLTLTIAMDDLLALGEGKLDPMTAVMTGKLGLSDMGVAMGLQGKMQALFSKLQA